MLLILGGAGNWLIAKPKSCHNKGEIEGWIDYPRYMEQRSRYGAAMPFFEDKIKRDAIPCWLALEICGTQRLIPWWGRA
jgi:hypothetical protein